jgi:hypothetical protein
MDEIEQASTGQNIYNPAELENQNIETGPLAPFLAELRAKHEAWARDKAQGIHSRRPSNQALARLVASRVARQNQNPIAAQASS